MITLHIVDSLEFFIALLKLMYLGNCVFEEMYFFIFISPDLRSPTFILEKELSWPLDGMQKDQNGSLRGKCACKQAK